MISFYLRTSKLREYCHEEKFNRTLTTIYGRKIVISRNKSGDMKNVLILFFTLMSVVSTAQSINIDNEDGTVDFVFLKDGTKGTLQGVQATITFDSNNLSDSKITGSVNVNTINTGNKTRDQHLMADDMFNAEEFPTMKFEANSIYKEEGQNFAKGALTIKKITQEEVFKINVIDGKMIFTTTVDAASYEVFSKKNAQTDVEVTVIIPLGKDQ